MTQSSARNHVLFPVLDTAAKNSFHANEGVGRLEVHMDKLHDEVKAMRTAMKELKELRKSREKQLLFKGRRPWGIYECIVCKYNNVHALHTIIHRCTHIH